MPPFFELRSYKSSIFLAVFFFGQISYASDKEVLGKSVSGITPANYSLGGEEKELSKALLDSIPQNLPKIGTAIDTATIVQVLNLLLFDESQSISPPPSETRLHCDDPRPDICPDHGETDYLYLYSEVGDAIGFGETKLIRKIDTQKFDLNRNSDNGISAFIEEMDLIGSWFLHMTAARRLQLEVGRYIRATRFPFQANVTNGFSFYGTGKICNTLYADFEIFEVEYNPAGLPIKLAVNFKQNCEFSLSALYGYLRFNSTIPMHPD